MKLYAAPLQGFTEAPWRNLHQEVFGGIDAYYTPPLCGWRKESSVTRMYGRSLLKTILCPG